MDKSWIPALHGSKHHWKVHVEYSDPEMSEIFQALKILIVQCPQDGSTWDVNFTFLNFTLYKFI